MQKRLMMVALLLSGVALFGFGVRGRHVFASGQTAANSCSAGQFVNSQLVNTGQSCGTPSFGYVKGVTGTITGTLLAVGGVDSGTVSVSGATVGQSCGAVAATDGTNPSSSVTLSCRVATAGVVTVEITAAAISTPASKAYNFVLFK